MAIGECMISQIFGFVLRINTDQARIFWTLRLWSDGGTVRAAGSRPLWQCVLVCMCTPRPCAALRTQPVAEQVRSSHRPLCSLSTHRWSTAQPVGLHKLSLELGTFWAAPDSVWADCGLATMRMAALRRPCMVHTCERRTRLAYPNCTKK